MAQAPPAAGKGQGLAVAGCNYVGQDQIWKDHVGQEEVAAKKWPANWSFLTKTQEELMKDDPNAKQFKKKDTKGKARLPTPLQIKPVTPLDQIVTVLPSTKPVPRTQAGLIGWRSSEPSLKLEKYGGYARSKGALIKQLNWPHEAIA